MRKTLNKIIYGGKQAHIEILEDLLEKAFDKLEESDYDFCQQKMFELHKIAYGCHLSEDMANEWVAEMQNKDGSLGEHWTIEQTNALKGDCDPIDFYAVMNMMYSDYYNSKYSTNDYVQLTKDWLNDPDAESDKTLKYYYFILK